MSESTASMDQKRCQLVAGFQRNHNGDFAVARDMVDAAVACGCDAITVPRRQASEYYSRKRYQAPCHTYPRLGDTFGQVMEALELSSLDLSSLREYCRGRVQFIGAPYEPSSLEELAALEPDGYQIDPPLLTHAPMLQKLATQGKAILVALGMCTDRDIAAALDILGGCDLTFLHCVSASPLALDRTNLAAIPYLQQRYGLPVGYLDGADDSAASLAALPLGATIIEKPFTLSHHLCGPDHAHSADRDEWRRLAQQIRALEVSLAPTSGRVLLDVELDTLAESRASLVAARDLVAGTKLTADLVATRAPMQGLSPNMLKQVLGRRLLYDLPSDEAITFAALEP